MVRILEARVIEGDKLYIIGACASDDEKPVGNYVTGSKMIEADTGDEYRFVEGDTPAWVLTAKGAGHKDS